MTQLIEDFSFLNLLASNTLKDQKFSKRQLKCLESKTREVQLRKVALEVEISMLT